MNLQERCALSSKSGVARAHLAARAIVVHAGSVGSLPMAVTALMTITIIALSSLPIAVTALMTITIIALSSCFQLGLRGADLA